MWFVKGGRASGKTTLLIQQSALTGHPIMVGSYQMARLLKDRAKEMNLRIPEPIVWKNEKYYHAEVLMDDGEELINQILRERMGIQCVGMAIRGPLTVLDRPFPKGFASLPQHTLARLEFERYVNGAWGGPFCNNCSICKNAGSELCRECKMEVKSAFELKED